MPTEILMPALSPTMEEGTLAKWHVREGDEVRTGDVIAEIETDKATMEVEAIDDGRVGKILVAEGTEHVPVNKPIALLLTDGEDISAASAETPSPQPSPHRGDGDSPCANGEDRRSDQVGTAVPEGRRGGRRSRRGAARGRGSAGRTSGCTGRAATPKPRPRFRPAPRW